MKILKLARYEVKVDDEDYPKLFIHRWKVYWRGGSVSLKAWDKKEQRQIYLPYVLFPELIGTSYRVRFKDRDPFNWQRDNIIIRIFGKRKKTIIADWCPHGPATLSNKSGRSELCLTCPDWQDGPYWRCLSETAKHYWDGWRRDD